MSQESHSNELADLEKATTELDVNSPKKVTRKRGRPSGTKDSPAKKASLKKSASTSSISTKGRGRPTKERRSLMAKIIEPPVAPFSAKDYPNDGVLLAFGMGDAGQLGMTEDVTEKKRPQPVKKIEEPVMMAAAGGMHNVFLTTSGHVYTFGCNDEGALGRSLAEEEESFLPGKVEGVSNAVFCSAGDSHTAIINEAGEVWVWGTFRDANGRLGVGTGEDDDKEVEKAILKEPAKLSLPHKVMRIASGADHIIMLDFMGNVWSLGCAESGQLGRVSSHFCAKGGRRGAGKILNPEKVYVNKKLTNKTGKVIGVACGQFCSFLLTESGKVIGFGLNNCFQLGFDDREIRYIPTIIPFKFDEKDDLKFTQVQSGMHHTMLLSDEGHVYTIGCGDYGRLGVGQEDKLRETDTLMKVEIEGKVTKIARGSCTSYAIVEDGSCFAWGMGSNLQLTNGSEDDEWVPVQLAGKNLEGKKVELIDAGGQHAIVLLSEKE